MKNLTMENTGRRYNVSLIELKQGEWRASLLGTEEGSQLFIIPMSHELAIRSEVELLNLLDDSGYKEVK